MQSKSKRVSIHERVFLSLLIICMIWLCSCKNPTTLPQIILDTDIGGDIDDLGALYLLHQYADAGQCDILGVMTSWSMAFHVDGVDAVNTWFGRPDLPVGAYEGAFFEKDEYTWYMSQIVDTDLTGRQAPKSAALYRKLLSGQPDTSVTIVVTGRLNNIYDLFRTGPDSISPLTGFELAEQKVKSYFIMGGRYPEGSKREANFRYGEHRTKYVIDRITRPIVFNGGNIGLKANGYFTGSCLNDLPDDNILKAGYQYFFQNPPDWTGLIPSNNIQDWSIWDLITVQLAVTGIQDYFNEVSTGYNAIDSTGLNQWMTSPDKNHAYVTAKMDPETYSRQVIENLLMN